VAGAVGEARGPFLVGLRRADRADGDDTAEQGDEDDQDLCASAAHHTTSEGLRGCNEF
jgi:hypothetical protein